MGIPHSSNVNVLRLSYNVKKNMENSNNEEIEVKGDDLQINNQNIELDFAEEDEDDEALPVDEYSTPTEKDQVEPRVKPSSEFSTEPSSEKHYKPTYATGNLAVPGHKAFEKIDTNKIDQKALETDEFVNDIDEKFKNLMQADKRDFKHLSNMNNTKSRKLISAHSELEQKAVDNQFFKTEPENIEDPIYNKIGLSKGRSHLTNKKPEPLVSAYTKIPDRKMQNLVGLPNPKYPLITKSKSVKETPQVTKELTKSPNPIKFYPTPSAQTTPGLPDKKEKFLYKEPTAYKSASAQQTAKKMCPKPLEQLMIHHSDTAVKPIIGNKDIERIVEPVYKPDYLTFSPWTPDQFEKKIETQEIENYMSEIYNAIVSNSNLTERVHALSYFESLITNSNVSNRLINSAFLTLFVHMLDKSTKSHMIKIRICSIIGLLIRHATVIENEVAESGICSILCQTLDDTKENVRRKAIAALGEYLFYAATQLDDDQVSKVWIISEEAISALLK
jgi:hypothetical protein